MSPHQSIMIVDDDEDIRDTLRYLLEDSGYTVVTARNGSDALDRLHEGARPAVILLDLMMPVMDGYQFVTEKVKHAALAPIPIIVVTADGNANEKAESIGAVSFLRKPFSLDTVLRTVARYRS